MFAKILRGRQWNLKFSILNRSCYLSGQNLKFTWCYRGRKKIFFPLIGYYYHNDDIWVSQSQYLKLIIQGEA